MCCTLLTWCAAAAALAQFQQTKTPSPSLRSVRSVGGNSGGAKLRKLEFWHLTTDDGLSQGYVDAILQDHRGFMWFATRDGLNRYDGNAFVVYKNNADDPGSLSSNFIQDIVQDNHGYLWVATNAGVNKFDPASERCVRYLHEPDNPNSLGAASVKSIIQDSRGFLWFVTQGGGLDKFDPTSGRFTHFRNDTDGHFVGRVWQVIEESHREIWFVSDRGLFHLNQATGQISHLSATSRLVSARSMIEDEAGALWILCDPPITALVKYDRQTQRLTRYPLRTDAGGFAASTSDGTPLVGKVVADGRDGLWVPTSNGLYYFDRTAERFTYRFQHDETDPGSLDSNAVLSVYRDRGGVLWVGTENAGLNALNLYQEKFTRYVHRPADPNSLSPGRVKAIYQDRNDVLWIGLFPRTLDRFDRKTGQITHYLPRRGDENSLGKGASVEGIYKDAAGRLWIGGEGSGLARLDERTGQFRHYHQNAGEPNSLISDDVYTIYGDRSGQIWIGQGGGISRFEPATDRFTQYRPVPDDPASPANSVWVIDQDRSGTLWLGTWGGVLSRFDEQAKTFVNYTPDPHDPHKLHGGGINTIHEDRSGILWVGAIDGLYRFNRLSGAFTRYTENQGLPSSTIRCIREDGAGRLWLSTQKGISRFDPRTERFRNFDVSDGLQSNEFSDGCYESPDGEMFFGGSNGFNAFFPENVRDNLYVPPVVITSFKIFNRPVPIGADSVLKKAIPYVDSLTLSYRDDVFSFEFASLSYANSKKNRYRYRLDPLEPGWNEVGSKQRIATYTNLDAGKYIFRVQGSNSDGVWNEEGVSLTVIITPPWWEMTWFRVLFAVIILTLLWAAYQWRLRQLHHQFEMTLQARIGERTRIARELHDTLLQSFHGVLLRLAVISQLLRERPVEAQDSLESTIEQAAKAITEGRDAVQGLRASAVQTHEFAQCIRTLGEELASDPENNRPPEFQVTVEGESRDLHPILRDEIYRIAGESLRNAFRHAGARRVEVEIRYGSEEFRVRVRDDGKGMDAVVSGQGRAGHYGLPGMRERAKLIGGKLTVWSELGQGSEVELEIPASTVYAGKGKRFWLSNLLARR